MKKTIALIALFLAVGTLIMSIQAQEKKETKKESKVETLTCWTSVDCEACKTKIEKNIAYEKGVKDLKVDLKTKLVTVTYRKDKTTPEKLEKAIQDLGYKTEVIKEEEKSDQKKK